jgi:hypothetical protein
MPSNTYSPMSLMSQPDLGMGSINDFGGAAPWSQVSGMPDLSGFGAPDPSSGWFGIKGLGLNMPTAQMGLDGLKSIGGLYASLGALGVAKKQLALSSMVANKNIANQTASYNTALSDRARSRGVAEGQTQATVDDYIKKNSLSGT